MNSLFKLTSTALMAFIFAGCANTNPKISFQPDVKKSIKNIALVDTPDPAKYTLFTRSTASSLSILLGPIGAAIGAGYNIDRFQTDSTKFTAAVLPLKPNLNSIFLNQIESGLKLKGYDVVRVPAPPLVLNSQEYDLSKINDKFDTVLTTSLYGGYWEESGSMTIGVAPRIVASISLTAAPNNHKLFVDSYVYGTQQIGNMIQVIPEQKFLIPSTEEMFANIELAAEGLQTGANKIADRVLQDF